MAGDEPSEPPDEEGDDEPDTDGEADPDPEDSTDEPAAGSEPTEDWSTAHDQTGEAADASETGPEPRDGSDDADADDAESAAVDADDSTEETSEMDSDDAPDESDESERTAPPAPLEGGPAEDREMPLAEHIEEMLKRLAVIIAIAGVVSLLAFPFAERIINFLWYSILPGVESEIARPRLYGVLELLFTQIKVASLAGLIVALPVMVYQTYAFMRPGLYPHERRYYLAAVPTSLVLALVGVSFAYFVVLPAIFLYFLEYSQSVATIGFALGRTFDLILLLMGYMAIVFQIPLFILLAMMMGLTSRQWLADRRLLFWGAFLGISFLFSPDPTGMAPILVAATMIVLFEGTLLLTKWTGRG